MADRYWVGGTGTWDSTSTANWSASSGGASGASVPTASDNVFFDANSNVLATAFIVTMANTPRVCNDFTASGLDGTMTLAGASIGLTVSGNLTFQATNFTRTYTGTTTFNATTTGKTVTTNGVAFGGAVVFDGIGGGWTLGSALSTGSGALTITNGTFDTSSVGNYSITAGSFSSSNTNTRTINLNGSTITLSNGGSAFSISSLTGLTFNASTSQINISSNSVSVDTAGVTFYNVSFTNTSGFTRTITGANTFNNLTSAAKTSVGICILSFGANQTINGTLTLNAGTASAYRTMVASNTIGTQRTLTCAAISSVTDIDFRDINFAGAISLPVTGTRLGDCKGNSNITFPAAKTVYYRQTGTNNWGQTTTGSWSATSGGSLDGTMFPLAQDTAVFPAATYPASGSTVSINASYNIGTIDMSLRTSNTMALSTGTTAPQIYGNWINGTGITFGGTGRITFAGRTSQTITSAGISFGQPFTIDAISGSVTLQDALTSTAATAFTLTSGTFDANNYNVTLNGQISIGGTSTRTLALGSGTFSTSISGTAFTTAGLITGLTVTGTGTINLTSASAKTFSGGGLQTYPTINQGGAGALTFVGSNGFANITNTVQPATVLFTAGTTTTFSNFSLSGTAGNLITIGSVTAASHTLSKASGTVSGDYLSISRSTATGGASWYAGANSTDGGNNTGWIFTAPPSGGYVAGGQFMAFF